MALESERPLRTRDDEILSDGSLSPERGWHDMDVKWLITNANMGSHKTVVGRTLFPPGSKHDVHRHPNAEEWEYVLSHAPQNVVITSWDDWAEETAIAPATDWGDLYFDLTKHYIGLYKSLD